MTQEIQHLIIHAVFLEAAAGLLEELRADAITRQAFEAEMAVLELGAPDLQVLSQVRAGPVANGNLLADAIETIKLDIDAIAQEQNT